ncbi:MAG: hypothetical protein HZB51_18335 [Chloroflexi bacterium]|nr:hypothetical protein [Chloroflexota bacterium]
MRKSRRKQIEKNLRKTFLENGPFALALFEYELQEHIAEYLQSKQADHDNYLFAVTEHSNDVAMVLIDERGAIHINEDARAMLKELWPKVYRSNMELFLPDMARDMDAGYIWWTGVKVATEAQIRKLKKEDNL